jgi:hypothetical protein
MFYLRYLCLLAYGGVQHILGCIIVWLFFVCVTHVASFSRLPIFDCPFSNVYLHNERGGNPYKVHTLLIIK